MHNDLQLIEAEVLGVANREGLPLDERVNRLANALHGLLRVVSNALEELDDRRAGDHGPVS